MQTILARWTRRKEKLRPVDHASNVWRSSAVRVIGSAKFIHKYYDIVGPEVKLKVNLFMTHYTRDIHMGIQNISEEEFGAKTGEVSVVQAKQMGVKYVIVGHSERRAMGETDAMVNNKGALAIKHGRTPVYCVGELLEQRESNEQFKVVGEQIKAALLGRTAKELLHSEAVIAYEPVWAIGTGKTASPEQAEEMLRFIRKMIFEKYGTEVASKVRIQYGGSVKPGNAKDLIKKTNVDGGLVGGASEEGVSAAAVIDAFGTVDKAMDIEAGDSPVVTEWHQGGINLDPAMLNMEIKRDGHGMLLPASQQPVMNMNVEGLFPVIISVTPVSAGQVNK